MIPKRIQMRRTKGWRKPPNAIYVGRSVKWGNPFRVGEGGVKTRKDAVRLFRSEFADDIAVNEVGLAILQTELRGRDLACWCPLCARHADGLPLGEKCADCAPCHASVLLELANK